MKAILIKISSIVLILILLVQVSMLSFVTFMYTNYNEVLTLTCCINKEIDDDCNAKCFVVKTQEQEEDQQSTKHEKKEVYIYNELIVFNFTEEVKLIDNHILAHSVNYSFLYGSQSPRPPIS